MDQLWKNLNAFMIKFTWNINKFAIFVEQNTNILFPSITQGSRFGNTIPQAPDKRFSSLESYDYSAIITRLQTECLAVWHMFSGTDSTNCTINRYYKENNVQWKTAELTLNNVWEGGIQKMRQIKHSFY